MTNDMNTETATVDHCYRHASLLFDVLVTQSWVTLSFA